MTFREIIEREDQNTDSIWLYREGLFMKAYERSAFFAHTLIHEFKVNPSNNNNRSNGKRQGRAMGASGA